MNILIIIATCVTALATASIAFSGIASLMLAKELKRKDDEFHQQVSDLYQAIVIATIVQGDQRHGLYQHSIDAFKKLYIGKTPIFKEYNI